MSDIIILPLSINGAYRIADNNLIIRHMKLDDIERVHHIDQLSFSLPWPISSYHYELTENHASIAHVAELINNHENSTIIAMIVTWIIVDEAHIATIAVHPDYRRMGIGARLLAESLQEAINRGARMATLEVRQSNVAAISMYDQLGFIVTGRRSRYYQDTHEDAYIMTNNNLNEANFQKLNRTEGKFVPEQEEPHEC